MERRYERPGDFMGGSGYTSANRGPRRKKLNPADIFGKKGDDDHCVSLSHTEPALVKQKDDSPPTNPSPKFSSKPVQPKVEEKIEQPKVEQKMEQPKMEQKIDQPDQEPVPVSQPCEEKVAKVEETPKQHHSPTTTKELHTMTSCDIPKTPSSPEPHSHMTQIRSPAQKYTRPGDFMGGCGYTPAYKGPARKKLNPSDIFGKKGDDSAKSPFHSPKEKISTSPRPRWTPKNKNKEVTTTDHHTPPQQEKEVVSVPTSADEEIHQTPKNEKEIMTKQSSAVKTEKKDETERPPVESPTHVIELHTTTQETPSKDDQHTSVETPAATLLQVDTRPNDYIGGYKEPSTEYNAPKTEPTRIRPQKYERPGDFMGGSGYTRANTGPRRKKLNPSDIFGKKGDDDHCVSLSHTDTKKEEKSAGELVVPDLRAKGGSALKPTPSSPVKSVSKDAPEPPVAKETEESTSKEEVPIVKVPDAPKEEAPAVEEPKEEEPVAKVKETVSNEPVQVEKPTTVDVPKPTESQASKAATAVDTPTFRVRPQKYERPGDFMGGSGYTRANTGPRRKKLNPADIFGKKGDDGHCVSLSHVN